VELPSHRDAQGGWDQLQFFLKVDLMHMEATEDDIKCPGQGSGQFSKQRLHRFDDEGWVTTHFKCVSSRLYKLNHIITLFKGAAKGLAKQKISHSLHVALDSMHFSSVTLSLHSMLMGKLTAFLKSIDFKFRNTLLIH
jgi:hypothetical protein